VRWVVDGAAVDAASISGRRFEPCPSPALEAGAQRADYLRDVALRAGL
jgi:hypothetical protein